MTTTPLPSPAPQAVTFGEVMAMFVADERAPLNEARHFTRALAGAEVNVATGLVRLGHSCGWIGRVGDDPLGSHAVAELQQEGIDVRHVCVDPEAPTAFQLKSRTQDGDPQVVYFRKNSAGSRLAPAPAVEDYLRGARHLHVTGIPAALSPGARDFTLRAMEVARAAGLTISFDPNLRPVLWSGQEEMIRVVNDLACRADWVLPGLQEGMLLTGATGHRQIADYYLERGVRRVVLKDGTHGATLIEADGLHTQAAFAVPAVDSVGAGDGFAAGLISAHLDGLDGPSALQRAAAVGALATTSHGDRDGLPQRTALDAFLQGRAAA